MQTRPAGRFALAVTAALIAGLGSPGLARAETPPDPVPEVEPKERDSALPQNAAPAQGAAPAQASGSAQASGPDAAGAPDQKPKKAKKRVKTNPDGSPAAGSDKSAEKSAEDGASPVSEVINALDYPELQVVPRASDRLRMEARDEQSSWYYMHWQMQLSGLATLGTALSASGYNKADLNSNDKTMASSAATVGTAIGGGWLIAGFLLGMQRPYEAGLEKINKIKSKDERSVLLRERLAEETLAQPAKAMRPLKWAAVVTNFAASAAMGVYMTDKGRLVAGFSAFLAFLPLIYEDRQIEVYDRHLDYKRRIYRPFTSLDFRLDPNDHRPTPMARMIWDF